MSLRKNQLKKMTMDEIMLHLSTETNSDNIKLITNYIAEKNSTLTEKRNALLNELATTRNKIEKNVKNLNGRVKDRIDKKQTIIMDKDSRPTAQSITQLMNLFSYLEEQGRIISRNNNSIKEVSEVAARLQQSLQGRVRMKFDDLDRQFEILNAECQKEEVVRDALLKERNEKRSHYANIQQSIEAYRREYEKVEAQIAERERELIQLVGYYDARVNQDKLLLQELPARSLQYEEELLSAQSQLNSCWATLNDRRILQIEQSKCAFQ